MTHTQAQLRTITLAGEWVDITLAIVAALALAVFALMFTASHPAVVAGQAVPAASVDVCALAAQQMLDTHDYTGSATQRACFGEEDDPRVGLALDYGQTVAGYALAEAAQG